MNHIRSFRIWRALWAAGAAAAAIVWAAPSIAADYPEKPIRILMPWGDGFPANSPHLYGQELAKRLKQPVVLEVRAGAGGEIAARQVRGAPRDGYTLLATGTSITTSWASHPGNVDPENELQPVGQIVMTPYVIVARSGRFNSFRNFLAAARAAPGTLNYASPGIGTGMHFLGELIKTNSGIDMVHVPYATGARQLQAVLGGDVDIAIISLVTALPQIRSGRLEALAVSTTARSKVMAEVPTLAESGVPGMPNIASWIALFAPRGVPPAVLARLSEHIAAVSNEPAVRDTVAQWGAEIPDTSSGQLGRTVRAEKAVWARLAKEKHITTEPD
ncbi:tripartite tricarboxylate transporter substrate-binding protein [Cupriavidus sp. 30B13]|uniref:tripartite tricarboxylate transporter substrate-binding protein n=1 Tax=Cupriavidus sp. 30B13 TaxID=3384241 RepID=UPI003B9053B4